MTAPSWPAARLPDAGDVAAFQRDGAVCLRGLLASAELQRLARGIDANLAAPSPRAIVASRADDPGFFIEDFGNCDPALDGNHQGADDFHEALHGGHEAPHDF